MIVVEDVYKRYMTDHGAGKWVLEGVSFEIPPKLSVGLVGGNGAGKSTLLRLIGGVDVPTRGRIERNCSLSWPMGFGGGLQPSLTGRQNTKFVCRIHGHEDDIKNRIAFVEDFAELGDSFDEPVKTYSTGMRSRLQFGLSLAFDFDVYISDEVTAAGDAAFKDKAAAAFKKLTDHASIIMVSHAEGTLRQFCSAGIWLHEGRARWFDDINEALREYKKSQLNDQIEVLLAQQLLPGNQEKTATELEAIQQRLRAILLLEEGVRGIPATVDHEEGLRIIREANQQGMQLIGLGQLVQLGKKLKPGAQPILNKYYPAPHNKHLELYDLKSQCVELESIN